MSIHTRTHRTTLLAVSVLFSFMGSSTPIVDLRAPATAQAQPRQNRDARRAGDYSDSDLSRLSSITVRGQIDGSVKRDVFEFRAENGIRYRVLVRSNVSTRGLSPNARIQIEGKRDGNIIIATTITSLAPPDSTVVNLNAKVIDNLSGNRFTIRQNYTLHTVVADNGKPFGLRPGSEVDMTGKWRNNIFYASGIRLRASSWEDKWMNGQATKIRGTITSNLYNNRFTLRKDNGLVVTISTLGSNIRRASQGDVVEIQGRWERNGNVFLGTRLIILQTKNINLNPSARPVYFQGRVANISKSSQTWIYKIQLPNKRYVTVHSTRMFQLGNRVEVEGTVQNDIVIASRMNKL